VWNQGTYRLDNLVYHRSNKCAGTFFSELFLKNGWQEIQADQINNSDVHFGIIIDPVVRRAKAITERIFMANIKEQIDNPQFLRFIADICVVDEHNIPYYVQFKHLKDIKLFPLFDNIFERLNSFFKENKHDINLNAYSKEGVNSHFSNQAKLEVFEKVKKCLNSSLFDSILHEDIQLYKHLVSKL